MVNTHSPSRGVKTVFVNVILKEKKNEKRGKKKLNWSQRENGNLKVRINLIIDGDKVKRVRAVLGIKINLSQE